MSAVKIQRELRQRADPDKAKFFPRFFKAGPGQYAQGDKFIGVTVPQSRQVAAAFANLPAREIKRLLDSPIHEERLVGLLILVRQFQTGTERQRGEIFKFYLRHTSRVNNWDLVDASAYHIVGEYLADRNWRFLIKLAKSKNLWERRIAMIATLAFMRRNNLEPVFHIASLLLADKQDLIHKAAGWMLREAGKRDKKSLVKFLRQNQNRMPRTTLRYAIERFTDTQRRSFLK